MFTGDDAGQELNLQKFVWLCYNVDNIGKCFSEEFDINYVSMISNRLLETVAANDTINGITTLHKTSGGFDSFRFVFSCYLNSLH